MTTIQNIVALKQKYERRLRGLNQTVKKHHSQNSKETSFYVGRRDELEKVIEDLQELMRND